MKVGEIVKVQSGDLKGRFVKIVNYLQAQFQGKSLEKIFKREHALVSPARRRGVPMDDKLLLVNLYPNMTLICVHESELTIEPVELPPEPVKKPATRSKKEKLQ